MYSPCFRGLIFFIVFQEHEPTNLWGGGGGGGRGEGTADRETIINCRVRGQTGETVKNNLNRLKTVRVRTLLSF